MAYEQQQLQPPSPSSQGAYRSQSGSPTRSNGGSFSRSQAQGALVSLDNFNEHAGTCLINSPRSLAALSRLGLEPSELMFRPPSHRAFTEGVDSTTAQLLPDFVQRRFNHYESKRQAKVRAAREERAHAIAEAAHNEGALVPYQGSYSPTRTSAHHGADSVLLAQARERASTALEMEKEEIARMQQRLRTKLNNTLAFEIRRAQTLDRAQSKVDYANARAEAEKQYRAQQQAARDEAQKAHVAEQQRRLALEAEQRRQASEQAWRDAQAAAAAKLEAEREQRRRDRAMQADHRNRSEEKRRQLESINAMQRARIEEKEAELQRKEAERQRAAEEERRRMAEYHAQQQHYHKSKLNSAAARQAQQAEEKRQRWTEKEQLAEQKRREFEAEREWEREQTRLRAQAKDEALRQAQAQADALLRAKAEATLAKERRAAERLAEQERLRAMDEHERRQWLADRENMRKDILHQSYAMREQRGQQILAKRAALNHRSEEAMRRREAEIRERKLAEQMLADDRREQVARMQRVQEHQRDALLHRIQADRERIDSLQAQSAQLAKQRLALRDMAERQQTALLQQFKQLAAHPERLRELDPDNVDVVRMGFLSQEDAQALMSFNESTAYQGQDEQYYTDEYSAPTPVRSSLGSGSHTPRRNTQSAKSLHGRPGTSAGRVGGARNAPARRSFDAAASSMDAPLPRPRTQQAARPAWQQQPDDFGQPSNAFREYSQRLATH